MVPFKTRAVFSFSGNKKTGELGFMEDEVIQVTDVIDEATLYGTSMRTKLSGKFPMKFVEFNDDHLKSIRRHVEPIQREISSSSTLNTEFTVTSQFGSNTTTYGINGEDHDTNKSLLSNSTNVPIPPKHETDLQASKKFKSSYVQQLIFNNSLTDTERSSSVFGHSDFSATSAGSLLRHKESLYGGEKSFYQEENGSNQIRDRLNTAIIEAELNRSANRRSGFFQRIIGKSSEKELSFDDSLLLSMERHHLSSDSLASNNTPPLSGDEIDDYNFNLKRSFSLNSKQRSVRAKRLAIVEPDMVLKPHKFITSLNKNETQPNAQIKQMVIEDNRVASVLKYLLNSTNLTLDRIISIVLKELSNDLERHKTIYLYLTHFQLYNSPNEKVSLKRMPDYENLFNIIKHRRCTPHQLVWIYYMVALKMNIEVELILGYLKHPYKVDESIRNSKTKLIINHSWISILLNGAYYFCDLVLGNPTSTTSDQYDEWISTNHRDNFILNKPFDILSTHIPRHIDQQHIVPPIDPIVQLNLPPKYPFFNKIGLEFVNFNTSLFHLNDYETYEIELKMKSPNHENYQIKCHFRPFDIDIYAIEQPLVQYHYNESNEKVIKIKGILPQFCPSGVVVLMGRGAKVDKEWKVISSIPTYHVGKWKQIKWVKLELASTEKYGSCYIKSPKIYNLPLNTNVNFKFKLSNFRAEKLLLIDPKGQKIHFNIENKIIDEKVPINTTGEWRLVVPDLERKVWKVIAEWKAE